MSLSQSSQVTFVPNSPVVCINYSDLLEGSNVSLDEHIKTAYGATGLGILVVKGVPNFSEYRQSLLPLANQFANLPLEIKKKYENEFSHFNFGWSHGKENLAGKPDVAKGSFYNNPQYDDPFSSDPELINKFPSFCAPNIWPKEDLPELEKNFKRLGCLMIDVGKLLAKHVDKYVHSICPGYSANHLHEIISKSRMAKGRLLHYFAPAVSNIQKFVEIENESIESKKLRLEEEAGSWCGWHNDHGSLTALCSALFLNEKGEAVTNPDPKSGLYIRNRNGDMIKAIIPPDCIAYQIGETQQIQSGGIVQATPHCVNAGSGIPEAAGISRETFAVFMEPEMFCPMSIPSGRTVEEAVYGSSQKFLPRGVPTFSTRYNPSMNFGEFTNATLKAYHPEN